MAILIVGDNVKSYIFLLLTFCSFLSHAHDVFKNEVINYMNYGHIPELVLVTVCSNRPE